MTRIVARSISRSVHKVLQRTPFVARVLAVFDHACDLATSDGDVIALVTPHIGDGPLNIVVAAQPGEFQKLVIRAGHEEASLDSSCSFVEKDLLQIGELQIDLGAAVLWEPRPDWNSLRNLALQATTQRALARLASQAANAFTLASIAPNAVSALRDGWSGNLAQLRRAAAQLAGLGIGLTPAGDDFLVGVMLWAWLAHPAPAALCRAIAQAAAPRTTTLSAAFLRCAAQGECSAAWHRLLTALVTDSRNDLDAAICQVLSYGATSGADTLAGFLWMDSTL